MEWIASGRELETGIASAAPQKTPFRFLPWVAAGLAFAALAAAVLLRPASRDGTPSQVRFEIAVPPGASLERLDIPTPSPDGRRIAFVARATGEPPRIYLRDLDNPIPRVIPGTENTLLPFWASDSKRLGFLHDGKLESLGIDGGGRQTICDIQSNFGGATWHGDTIVFANQGKLFRVPAAGGASVEFSGLPFVYWPAFLPSGKHILFSSFDRVRPGTDPALFIIPLSGGAPKRILSGRVKAIPAGPGVLLYSQESSLFSRPFDESRLDWTGEASPEAQGLLRFGDDTAGVNFASSWNGVIAYRLGSSATDLQLAWFDRSGKRVGVVGEIGSYSNPALSPDGRWLAVSVGDPKNPGRRDIWVYDLKRNTGARLTSDPGDETNPDWSPDGRRIAFTASKDSDDREIYIVEAGGATPPRAVTSGGGRKYLEQWSPDGRYLIYNQQANRSTALVALPLAGGAKPTALTSTPHFDEVMGRVSPNGRWLAYVSDESGREEIYVRPFDPSGQIQGGRKYRVSTDAGSDPQWRADGKEMLYLSGNALTAVDVTTAGAEFEAGQPKPLFENVLSPRRRNRFVASADGQRFLLLTPPQEQLSSAIQAIVNGVR